jgi:type III pantothenate kinase
MASLNIVAVSVGNTRTRWGVFQGRELHESGALENTDAGLIEAIAAAAGEGAGAPPVVIASVNNKVADQIEAGLRARGLGGSGVRGGDGGGGVHRIGRDIPIPLRHTLRADAKSVGQDRLLCALAAFARAEQACVVVDAGTAVTVDFVDGQGVFQGGVIAPGLNLMLKALHEGTAALPAIKYERPGKGEVQVVQEEREEGEPRAEGVAVPFGKNTRDAMLLGVQAAAQGLVHEMIDRYAEFYGAYPQIVATGGDAGALFEDDPLVEHIVADLPLMGIQIACEKALGDDDDEAGETRAGGGLLGPPSGGVRPRLDLGGGRGGGDDGAGEDE